MPNWKEKLADLRNLTRDIVDRAYRCAVELPKIFDDPAYRDDCEHDLDEMVGRLELVAKAVGSHYVELAEMLACIPDQAEWKRLGSVADVRSRMVVLLAQRAPRRTYAERSANGAVTNENGHISPQYESQKTPIIQRLDTVEPSIESQLRAQVTELKAKIARLEAENRRIPELEHEVASLKKRLNRIQSDVSRLACVS